MRFSLKELNNYFVEPLPALGEVVAKLTDHAFEVDEVLEKPDGDTELDIKVLPDRADDAKEPMGMARELSAVLGVKLKDEYLLPATTDEARAKINFSVEDINNLVGFSFAKNDIVEALNRVGVLVEGENELVAFVPQWRTDLNIKEDLADEVARLKGYANIPGLALVPMAGETNHHNDFILANQLRQFLAENNFTEIYGYTFRPEGRVEVEKPLASDKAFLRTDLAQGMEQYVKNNLSQVFFEDMPVKLFEIGNVFDSLDIEEKRLCVAVGYVNAKFYKKDETAKEITAKIASDFSGDEASFSTTEKDSLVIIEIPFSKLKSKPVPADLSPFIKRENDYKPFSVYPRIIRDIALWVPADVSAEMVAGQITESIENYLAVGPVLFDQFEKDGRVSYAFRMVFQSDQKTLTDNEVATEMTRVEEKIKALGYEIR